MFETSTLNARNKQVQRLVSILFLMMTLFLIVPVLIILGTLVVKGSSVISIDFLFTSPTDGMTAGGIFPALLGTVWLVAVDLVIAIPIGVSAAIYLSEYASARLRGIVKPVLEILAGVPTVVYGYFAALTVAPAFRDAAVALGMLPAPSAREADRALLDLAS